LKVTDEKRRIRIRIRICWSKVITVITRTADTAGATAAAVEGEAKDGVVAAAEDAAAAAAVERIRAMRRKKN
jgi:hypothetical protein